MENLAVHWVIPENIQTTPQRKLEVNHPTPYPTSFFPLCPPDSRNYLRGGVWIFSGTTHYAIMYATTNYAWLYLSYISQMTDKKV
jgi:hypothetical protein